MSNDVEFICYHCNNKVEYTLMPIQCDLCENWFHGKCEKLNRTQWSTLGNSEINWYCTNCKLDMFPFNKLDNDDFYECISGSTRELKELSEKNVCTLKRLFVEIKRKMT